MKQLFALLGGGLLAVGLSVGAFAADDGHEDHEHRDGEPVTVQGELIDTACYVAAEGDAKGKKHARCARKCMATGIPAGILPEGSKDAEAMMFLLTNPTVLAPYAAQTIKVEGTSRPGMHAIDVQKLYVKQGNGWKEIQLKDEHHKMSGGTDAVQQDAQKDRKDGHGSHEH